ncbi:MAG: chemotaxis protein CheA [Pseudomonadota bacterium]
MAIDADEEILQDFIVEAGEILEQLSEQLVQLENTPQDSDLLNAIFRSFHTVKGGAGFLNLTNLVAICHVTENIFDLLRNNERSVTSDLMDVVLQALDEINTMFDVVKQMEQPEPANPDLMSALEKYSVPGNQDEVSTEEVQETVEQPPETTISQTLDPDTTQQETSSSNSNASSDEITDEEFENLLDQLHSSDNDKQASNVSGGANQQSEKTPSTSDGEITDDEFDQLLDEIHGPGKGPEVKANLEGKSKQETKGTNSSSDDLMSDDEFEKLLDQLHGNSGQEQNSIPKTPEQKTSEKQPDVKEQEPVKTTEQKQQPAAVAKPTVEKKTTPSPTKSAAPAPKKSAAASPPAGETTVRVDTKRLDDIMNMVGELVLVRNRLVMLGANHGDEELAKTIQNLDVVTADLQGSVMKTRMQPIKKVFGRFPRVVRDLARSLNKEISLELVGEETDLDKNLVEALADPLIHLVRNSVDHGIEMPQEREEAGKPRTGKILLSAAQEGDHILLAIEDDGKGMNADVLRKKAVEKGLMDVDAAERLTPNECYNLIFMPGFSTKDQISDISGRGVGMDVVKTKISQLNGSINVSSELGKGTIIIIKVPLTLAILPTLMVTVGNQTFALPLASVNEIFHLDLTRTNNVDGQLTIIVRDKALPLFYLEEWLVVGHYGQAQKEAGHVVIVQVGTKRVGFVVDSLLGQEEVVIKPLGQSLQGTPGMAGATITSDGGIALILDIAGLLKHYASRR